MFANGAVYGGQARDDIYIVESENLDCTDRSQDLNLDTIQIDKEIGGEKVDWIYLAHDWTAVMNFLFP